MNESVQAIFIELIRPSLIDDLKIGSLSSENCSFKI